MKSSVLVLRNVLQDILYDVWRSHGWFFLYITKKMYSSFSYNEKITFTSAFNPVWLDRSWPHNCKVLFKLVPEQNVSLWRFCPSETSHSSGETWVLHHHSKRRSSILLLETSDEQWFSLSQMYNLISGVQFPSVAPLFLILIISGRGYNSVWITFWGNFTLRVFTLEKV